MRDALRRGDGLDGEALLDAFQAVPEAHAPAEHDRHDHHVQVVDEVGGEEVAHHGRPAAEAYVQVAAAFASASTSAGEASRKWNVVPPAIASDGRGWWVSTYTGVWNGGLSPHQPCHASSGHGPCCGPNLPRPMISAPMPRSMDSVMALSMPLLPPGPRPCIAWPIAVSKNHSCSRSPACPNGASSDWPSPVAKPSSEMPKLWTRTSWVVVIAVPLLVAFTQCVEAGGWFSTCARNESRRPAITLGAAVGIAAGGGWRARQD